MIIYKKSKAPRKFKLTEKKELSDGSNGTAAVPVLTLTVPRGDDFLLAGGL